MSKTPIAAFVADTKKYPIQRMVILKRIGDEFQQVMQWSKDRSREGAAFYQAALNRAEVLIELLEVEDCGSIGGFDVGQPLCHTIIDRWDWLFRKYDNPKGKRFGCGIVSYEEICDFFETGDGAEDE